MKRNPLKHKGDWMKLDAVKFFFANSKGCAVCGKTKGALFQKGVTLDIHHKWPKKYEDEYEERFGTSVHDTENLVVVCRICHGRWDAAIGQTPSPQPFRRAAHGHNLARLCKRWCSSKFVVMAPEYIKLALKERFFGGDNGTSDVQDTNEDTAQGEDAGCGGDWRVTGGEGEDNGSTP